jgi:hypothetical protein
METEARLVVFQPLIRGERAETGLFVTFQRVETYMEGKTEIAAAGSVIYLASNQMHSVRHVGTAPCRY